jgi:hypothetical protein
MLHKEAMSRKRREKIEELRRRREKVLSKFSEGNQAESAQLQNSSAEEGE